MTTPPIKFKTYDEAYEYASKQWKIAFDEYGKALLAGASEEVFEDLYERFPILKVDGPEYVDSLIED